MEFSDKLKKFAVEIEVEFIDLAKEFKRESLEGEKLFFDKDIHLNEYGHLIVADAIRKQYPQVFK